LFFVLAQSITENPDIDTCILGYAIYPAIPFSSWNGGIKNQLTGPVIYTKAEVAGFFCIEGVKKVIQSIAVRTKGGGHGNDTTVQYPYKLAGCITAVQGIVIGH
jgi:hypothetical protein